MPTTASKLGQPIEFRMPSLGADMEEGVLTEWCVEPGDVVKRGDIVAVVETQKGAIEVEIFDSGTVDRLLVPAGETAPVGAVLATLHPAGTPAPPPAGAGAPAPERDGRSGLVERPRKRVSPLARRLAADLGVDTDVIEGTGIGGAVTKADVERAADARSEAKAEPASPPEPERRQAPSPAKPPRTPPPAPAHEPESGPGEALSPMRRAIAAAMSRSKREVPHYYVGAMIDMERALRWLEQTNASLPVVERILPAAMLLRAAALALPEFREFNGFFENDAFHASERIHLGVAISLRGGGLVAPALHDADQKTVGELMRELRDLVNRARAGRIRSSELADATITITNIGEMGVEEVYGVIFPPQVAIIGFGRIAEHAWAEDGMVGARRSVKATLSGDHRVSDGSRGARLLARIAERLQRPEDL